jgi:hypothetical protein
MTEDIPNRELVVYALGLLDGDSKRIHTEDVAVKCHQLFPASFSWTKYPQYPDKDIVRVALTDARKKKYGALVEGRAGQKKGLSAKTKRNPIPDGWILTQGGIAWVRENATRLDQMAGSDHVREHRQKRLQQLKRIREHNLFVQFQKDPDHFVPSIGEMADMLRCRVDAERQIWMTRLQTIRSRAQMAGNQEIVLFVIKCEEVLDKKS